MRYITRHATTSAYESYAFTPENTPNVAFVDSENEVHFIKQIIPNGVYIYTTDGKFYTHEQWAGLSVKPTVVGVAVKSDDTSFVIHSEVATGLKFCTTWHASQDLYREWGTPDMLTDFNGKANTKLALDNIGTFPENTAAPYADAITFANGNRGYIPAAGQLNLIKTNISTINTLRADLNLSAIATGSGIIYTSSTCKDNYFTYFWGWNTYYNNWADNSKGDGRMIIIADI